MNNLKVLFGTALLVSTLACSNQVTSASPPTASSTAIKGASGFTSPGKPSAPARVEFASNNKQIVLGAPLSVRAVVTPTSDVDAIEVRFGLTAGLKAADALPEIILGSQKAGTAVTQDLVFSPLSEGMQFLSVFVTTRKGKQRMDKTVSYPVPVGNAALKAPSPVLNAPGGERVESMPATESRH